VLGAGFGMGADRFTEQVQEQTGIVLDRGEKAITCGQCGYTQRIPCNVAPNFCKHADLTVAVVREDLAAKAINGYREKNAKIRQFWRDIENAAKAAIQSPGTMHHVGRGGAIRYKVYGPFLWCALPSGRLLAYAAPKLKRRRVERDDGTSFTTTSIRYMGVNSVTRKWRPHWSYGGHLTENVVQAMARDLMASAMLRCERAGYAPVLTVHDEIVTETPAEFGSLDEFLKLMRIRPKWAAGLPVAAGGWEGDRYRK